MNNTAWFIGTLDHLGLWSTYTFWNLGGSLLCLLVIYGVKLLGRERNSVDIFIGNLCAGCAWMSLTCAAQCLLNIYAMEFAYGQWACYFEANFHFIGILVQFFSITAVSWRNYFAVVQGKIISVRTALHVSALIWLGATIGTFVIGYYSKTYLMPSGTYCFYEFSSLAFKAWFVPMMLFALASLGVCYCKIFCVSKKTHQAVEQTTPGLVIKISPPGSNPQSTCEIDGETARGSPSQSGRYIVRTEMKSPKLHVIPHTRPRCLGISARVASQSLIYVLVFFLGWSVAVVCSFYEVFVGPVLQEMDAALAIFGVIHTFAEPIVYGCCNARLRLALITAHPILELCLPKTRRGGRRILSGATVSPIPKRSVPQVSIPSTERTQRHDILV